MQDQHTHACVLRIFNGPLSGCEFVLDAPRTLFLVGPQATFCADGAPPSVPAEALYIPLEQGGCNFEVLLGDNSRAGCVIRLAGPASEELEVAYQTRTAVGGLDIALRDSEQPWDEELLAGHDDLPATPPVPKTRTATWPWWNSAAIGVVAVALLVGGWYSLRSTPVNDVRQLIAGATGDLQVISGSDRKVYVFAATERDANWARQVLMRNGQDPNQVRITHEERARLQKLLVHAYPALAWHRIDLTDVRVPQVWVSTQRTLLTPTLQRDLQALLERQAPYAREAQVRVSDDRTLAREAEQGLVRLAVPYERVDHLDSVTFTLQGSLQDVELAAVRDYVNGYYRRWGDRYVHFAVELKDDWLKGKSFQYGPKGYIKMTPSSWYFPKPV